MKHPKIRKYIGKPCYVRISDLSAADREKFKAFLGATLRGCPVPPGETPGDCAMVQDYRDFARGADPYEGLILMDKLVREYMATSPFDQSAAVREFRRRAEKSLDQDRENPDKKNARK